MVHFHFHFFFIPKVILIIIMEEQIVFERKEFGKILKLRKMNYDI